MQRASLRKKKRDETTAFPRGVGMGGAAFKRCPNSDDIHGERFAEHGSPFVSGQVGQWSWHWLGGVQKTQDMPCSVPWDSTGGKQILTLFV